MEILERIIHQINPGKWPEVNAMEAEFVKIESPFGFTEKMSFQMLAGGDGANTLVVERQWPSMAAMEAAYGKAMADPGWQSMVAQSSAIIKDTRYELLLVIS